MTNKIAMKLPSLQALGKSINRVVKRFPLQFLIAIVSTVVGFYLIENQEVNLNLISSLGKFLIVSNFGFTLLLSSDLFCEVNGYSKIKKWMLRVFIILGCAGIYFLIYPFHNKADTFRVFLLAFAFHLLAAVDCR